MLFSWISKQYILLVITHEGIYIINIYNIWLFNTNHNIYIYCTIFYIYFVYYKPEIFLFFLILKIMQNYYMSHLRVVKSIVVVLAFTIWAWLRQQNGDVFWQYDYTCFSPVISTIWQYIIRRFYKFITSDNVS